MFEPTIQLTGNIGEAPTLNMTGGGKAVTNFSVCVTPRIKDAAGNWQDDEKMWFRCTAWEGQAENIVESCETGSQVQITGRFHFDSWADKTTGEIKTRPAIKVDEIGLSLARHAARHSG